jgi:hypothetical protein
MKACRGGRGVTPFILKLGTTWRCVVSTMALPLYAWETAPAPPYPMNRRLNNCQIWTLFRKEKYFSSAGNRTPGRLSLGLVIYNNIIVTVSCIGIYLRKCAKRFLLKNLTLYALFMPDVRCG